MANIKDKIKKLLALAQSSNENEARDAMLKAREFMARNKLSEKDFKEGKAELVHLVSDIKWTTDSGEIWITDVCRMIADNYCCTASWGTPKGSRTHTLHVTGLGDDAEVCKSVIEYAVGFVRSRIRMEQRKNPRKDGKMVANSYAKGFILGLEIALEDQNEQEWGLVLVKPEEVKEYESNLGSKNVRTHKTEIDPLVMMRGQNDGMDFNKTKVIEQAV